MEPKAVAPMDPREAVPGPSRGWLLPYAVVVAVLAIDLTVGRLSTAGFLVLAPLLASRLSSDRGQVVAAGLVALATGVLLGVHAGGLTTAELVLRLALIAVGTGIALVNWGVRQRG